MESYTDPNRNVVKVSNRFLIKHDKILWKGFYGKVYCAYDLQKEEEIVVKEFFNDYASTLDDILIKAEKEFSTASPLLHKNIVETIALVEENGKVYMFLEWVKEGSLKKLIKEQPRKNWNEEQISRFTCGALAGLKYMHEQNVLHRDISPANMLLGANETIKLNESSLMYKLENNEKQVMSKDIIGFALFASPEVCHGIFCAASDIWALGCCVVEMATGKLPWRWDRNIYYFSEFLPLYFKIGNLDDENNLDRPHKYLKEMLNKRNEKNDNDNFEKPKEVKESSVTKCKRFKHDAESVEDSTTVIEHTNTEEMNTTNTCDSLVNSVEHDDEESEWESEDDVIVSAEMIEFLDRIFVCDPTKRPSAEQLLQFDFITKYNNVQDLEANQEKISVAQVSQDANMLQLVCELHDLKKYFIQKFTY